MMTDAITSALLEKMAEAPYSVGEILLEIDSEYSVWVINKGSAHDIGGTHPIQSTAQAECDRLNALHRAQYVQPLVDALEAMLSEEYEMATVIACDQRGVPPISAIETVRRIENQARQALTDLDKEGVING